MTAPAPSTSSGSSESDPIRALAAVGAGDVRLSAWSYAPRPLQPDDVEIRITAAGVCHSDLHIIRQEWGNNEKRRPIVPGHEIVGYVIRAGASATHKVGDRVAVGTIVGSCGKCAQCESHDEIYCSEIVDTYMGVHKATGQRTYGGYAERIVAPSKFVYALPEGLPSTTAAPLMCAGVTVFQPLKRYFFKGARVGVVGIGGLGHLGLQFARALGYASVTAITTTKGKEESCKKLGATDVLVISDKDAVKRAAGSLDVIVMTATGEGLPWDDYVSLLRVGGMLNFVGLPSGGRATLPMGPMIFRRISVSGSLTGGTDVTAEMLRVAAEHRVRVAVELFPLTVDGGNAALDRVLGNLARFRCVLVPEAELAAAKAELERGA